VTAPGAGPVPTRFSLDLPAWVRPWLDEQPATSPSPADQVALVLALATRQVEERSGGPFAAAVFDQASGHLLAVGVNLVVPASACIAHAEMVALALAGQRAGSFDLGTGAPATLVASTEPCAMCLGAIPWSGVSRLVCSASDEDARAIGFDEGHKPPDWVGHLERRGIEVLLEVERAAGRAVLGGYAARGGHVYNSATPGG
jgi:tRNA(Arg) A34 adenosine deaminase TadA